MTKHYCDRCGKEVRLSKYRVCFHNPFFSMVDEKTFCRKCYYDVIKISKVKVLFIDGE